MQAQAKSAQRSSIALTSPALLQRRCACGSTPSVDGECGECQGKRLQRQSGGGLESFGSPVSDMRSGSTHNPPESSTAALADANIGHDFSRIRVHPIVPTEAQTKPV